jgi:polyhydroxybutyrate depolymerase
VNRVLALFLICAPFAVVHGAGPLSAGTLVRRIEISGVMRSYRLHLPAGRAAASALPLVLVFHGGGSTAAAMERLTRFSELADRERFAVAYPEGLSNHWNDGRDPAVMGARADVDDVPFVAALIDRLVREERIDRKRVYATGYSNGAIFSHYLAARLSDRIAAIAPVAGGIADRFRPAFRPGAPVSVLIVQGTTDPFVPLEGGEVRGTRGRLVATQQAIELWVKANGCSASPESRDLPDVDPADGCRVASHTWSGGRDGADVTYYEMKGGGHTWPGGAQYLPQSLIGRTCRDVDATTAIWAFLARHHKP